jgi:hypothetical protein
MRALWPRVALLPLLLLLCTHGDAQYTLLAAPVCTLGAFFCSSANLTGGRAGEILSLDARATTVVFDWRVGGPNNPERSKTPSAAQQRSYRVCHCCVCRPYRCLGCAWTLNNCGWVYRSIPLSTTPVR